MILTNFDVLFCYFLLFCVIFCNFASFINLTLMNTEIFNEYAEMAIDSILMDLVTNPERRRYHAGYDLPDGSRLYFEYRKP